MKSWFYAERKTQTLRGVSTRPLRAEARPSSRAWPKAFQACDEQCTHLALLLQTFLLFPSPKPCFLFLSISSLNDKRKTVFKLHQVLCQPWKLAVHFQGHGAEERHLCHCLSFLLHFCYFNTTTRITLQQGDPAGRFQVIYKEKIIFILCSSFWTALIISLLEKELMAVFAI